MCRGGIAASQSVDSTDDFVSIAQPTLIVTIPRCNCDAASLQCSNGGMSSAYNISKRTGRPPSRELNLSHKPHCLWRRLWLGRRQYVRQREWIICYIHCGWDIGRLVRS